MDEIQEIVKEKKIPYYNDLAERANYDREAFSELYDHFFPRVYNWLFGKMMDRGAADDVVSVTVGVRGVVSLSSKAKLSGSGTYDDVYVVVE